MPGFLNPILKNLCEYAGFLKFKDWWYLNGIFVIGVFSDGYWDIKPHYIILGLIASSSYLASGYSLNEYHDHIKNKFRQAGRDGAAFIVIPYILIGSCLLAAFYISTASFLIVLLGFFVSWLYSSVPFRLKRFYLPRLFLNSLGFSIIFLLGVSLSGVYSARSWMLFLFVLILFFPLELIHTLEDIESDIKSGLKTPPVIFGIESTVFSVLAFFILLMLFAAQLYFRRFVSIYFLIVSSVSFFTIALMVFARLARYLEDDNQKLFAGIKQKTRIVMVFFGLSLLLLLLFNF